MGLPSIVICKYIHSCDGTYKCANICKIKTLSFVNKRSVKILNKEFLSNKYNKIKVIVSNIKLHSCYLVLRKGQLNTSTYVVLVYFATRYYSIGKIV